jgi:hypothetical protein
VAPDGRAALKLYHKLEQPDSSWPATPMPRPFVPVMASLDDGERELYLRYLGTSSWAEFAARCLGGLDVAAAPFRPYPRTVQAAYCASFRYRGGALAEVTLLADYRALPADDDIRRQWPEGMDAKDHEAYELALDGVRSLGPRPAKGWHAMLAWTANGREWRRAASLRAPHHA